MNETRSRSAPPRPAPTSQLLCFTCLGEVQLFDAFNLTSLNSINAHDSSLAEMAFNPIGKLLITASEKGTVIRVFNVETGRKIKEFRRGNLRNADIRCLSFSQDSKFIILSSNLETIHIFEMREEDLMETDKKQVEQKRYTRDCGLW